MGLETAMDNPQHADQTPWYASQEVQQKVAPTNPNHTTHPNGSVYNPSGVRDEPLAGFEPKYQPSGPPAADPFRRRYIDLEKHSS